MTHETEAPDNVIDLVRYRRMRFERDRTDEELALLDFDDFGFPRSLMPDMKRRLSEAMGSQLAALRLSSPELCEKLGLSTEKET